MLANEWIVVLFCCTVNKVFIKKNVSYTHFWYIDLPSSSLNSSLTTFFYMKSVHCTNCNLCRVQNMGLVQNFKVSICSIIL